MTQVSNKSDLRKQLDAVSDAKADILAAPFFEKEKAINKFTDELEKFLDNVVLKLDQLEGGKNG